MPNTKKLAKSPSVTQRQIAKEEAGGKLLEPHRDQFTGAKKLQPLEKQELKLQPLEKKPLAKMPLMRTGDYQRKPKP